MRVLIVGAGAVGQSFGYHLQKGGAEVHYLVKPRYVAEVRGGLTLWRLRSFRRPRRQPMGDVGVITEAAEAAAQAWDQVWLCVSSTALRRPWLAELLGGLGEATLVGLTPALDDRELLLQHCREDQLVQGVITLIAYQAPLPDDGVPSPGVAYWLPPLSACPFSGPEARTREVVRALKRGGMSAKRQPGAAASAATLSAAMMPHLVALEGAGWSFERLAQGERLALAARAARQALAVVAAETGGRVPGWGRWIGPRLIRTLMTLSRWVVPLPIQTYLAYHFTKVGDQTRMMIRTYIQRGRELERPVEALEELRRATWSGR